MGEQAGVCACFAAYSGDACEACAPGFLRQDPNVGAACVPDAAELAELQLSQLGSDEAGTGQPGGPSVPGNGQGAPVWVLAAAASGAATLIILGGLVLWRRQAVRHRLAKTVQPVLDAPVSIATPKSAMQGPTIFAVPPPSGPQLSSGGARARRR